jgi:N-carbamoyl-L-amino-acid hydrolase
MADLRRLAEFGKFGSGVDRTAFSEADLAARRWLAGRMREGGLEARIDRLGNVCGRTPGAARTVVIGSHTDTVPKGGWLDGALGVIYGLEVARARLAAGTAKDLGIEVVSFQDEEGTFLPFLGARGFCGELEETALAEAQGKDGRSLLEAIAQAEFSGAPVRLDQSRQVAYLEAHIEQGPRLEAEGRRIGVVTEIVGLRRFRLTSEGRADHAGTTPMALRRDGGAPLLAFLARLGAEFPVLGGPDTVWNIGSVALAPGASNVVPSAGEAVLEFRDGDARRLDRLEAAIRGWVAAANAGGDASLRLAPIAREAPTAMAPALGRVIAAAAQAHGIEPLWLPSGAGHDAMVVGRYIDAAMLFIPSIGGRSHDIVEDTAEADIVLGAQVLSDTVARLARRDAG